MDPPREKKWHIPFTPVSTHVNLFRKVNTIFVSAKQVTFFSTILQTLVSPET